ncbi:hypothetical protein B0919_23735 [Hymenobacter sp. CRA2]|nr:hypothetical protein B0919_23735 [Hymenobacter sp. CRA2]
MLLVFNRVDTTARVLAALRRVCPLRLYVAADGPRTSHPDDQRRCAAVRALITQGIDWPCELHTQFRDHNLNCGLGPATAINWFFEHEPEGIILEDDCVPSDSFFRFCAEMLARYRHDERVMHVGGNNFLRSARGPQPPGGDSYYFSSQVNSWGWATWRRAWQLYDFHLAAYPRLKAAGALQNLYADAWETRYRLSKIESVLRMPQPAHVWDYQWHFAVAAHSALCVVPAVNLVSNIGFGAGATHTHDGADALAAVPAAELTFPLRHPTHVLRDHRRDRQYFREFFADRVRTKLRGAWQRFTQAPAAPPAPEIRPSSPVSASIPHTA